MVIDNQSKIILETLIDDLEYIYTYFETTSLTSNRIIIRVTKLFADKAIKIDISDNHTIGLGSYAFNDAFYNGITQSNLMRFITILKEGISKN